MDTHNLPAALFLSERGTKVGLRRNEPFVKLRCHKKKQAIENSWSKLCLYETFCSCCFCLFFSILDLSWVIISFSDGSKELGPLTFFYAVLRVFQDLPAFLLVIPNNITERKVSILPSPLSSIIFSFRSTWKTLDQEKRNE